MPKKILLIGTLDTKGREVDYLRQKVREKGCDVVVMDVGTLGEPLCRPDISQEEVAYAGGENFSHMKSKGSRSYSVEVITRGAINKTIELYSQEQLAGVLAIGGGTGTAIGTAVMRSLPLGIPKVMVSTVASRNVGPYVGTSDIVMFHSVVDLVGLNAITKVILDRAAGIVAGMTQGAGEITSIRPLVAATAFGICTMTAALAEPILAEKGYEMVTFHANGAGGRALEQLIGQGLFSGVLDFVIHELADQLYNGYCGDIGPDRLTTAAKKGVPIIIAPGGLDCIVFKSIDDVPQKLRQRKIYHHDVRVAVSISEEELSKIARTIAERVARPKGPVGILIPLMGWSELDRQGGFAFEPQLVYSFTKHLKAVLPPGASLQEIDCHISDPRFAQRAVEWLDRMVRGQPGT
jgi:uncharacterized protein (UPF0261 family)